MGTMANRRTLAGRCTLSSSRARIRSIAAQNIADESVPNRAGVSDSRASTSRTPRAQASRKVLLASGLFFFSYLILQTLIPVYALFSEEWFSTVGWTMYTGLRPDPNFVVVYEGGARESLEQIRERLGIGIVVGAKVDTARFVPPHLCEALPQARAVVIRDVRSHNEEIHPCKP